MEPTVRHAFLILVVPTMAVAVIAAACNGSSSSGEAANGDDSGTTIPPGTTPSSGQTGPAGSGLATGLPCDVQGILESRCIVCHGGPTEDPPQLLDYADLIAPSKKDPTKTMAQASLELMKGKAMPPTPAVPAEDDEIASFEEWVNGGAKQNPTACTDPPPPDVPAGDGGVVVLPDGGNAGDGGLCTSGKLWTMGDQGSPLMNPGEACNACHAARGGPNLRIAGTVYPSLHEPNDCNGSQPPVRVVVTDSRNKVFTMTVNAAGNFLTQGGDRPRPPLKAVVTDGAKTRPMVGSVTSGDCNSCHTQAGTKGAPGRIMAP